MKSLFFTLSLLSLTSLIPATAQSVKTSVIRVNSTIQHWSISQPWDKTSPMKRRALGALLSGNRVLTTAEMATETTYIELENSDNTRTLPAKVIAIDYETNLALLAPDDGDTKDFFKDLQPLELAQPAKIGDKIDVWQLEDNGMPLVTQATIRGVDVIATFAPGHFFLTYEAKGSMQSASSSFTLPVVRDGKLLGLLSSYDSKDQIINIITPEIIQAFLNDAKDGTFEGTPSLGIGISSTVDPNFRKWLKLSEDVGGIYVTRVLKKSAADKAGIKKGDVILSIDNHAIGRRGYYSTPNYGRIFWSHLVRGTHKVGDKMDITVLRDGKKQTLSVTLTRAVKRLIPSYTYDKAPAYLVKGGFIFQELTSTYLQAFGSNPIPLNLLDAAKSPEKYGKGRNRLIILTATIPTPATTGYERLNNYIIDEVNGKKITDMASLIEAFQHADNSGIHTIKFLDGTPKTIYLGAQISDLVDAELLKRGISSLSRK